MCELCRRSFIGGIAAFGIVGAIPTPLRAQAQMGPAGQASSSGLPARGEFVIRNGFVLTMDPDAQCFLRPFWSSMRW